jgi:hypothetical protein
MYTGFNAKKERKRTKIEKLQDEIKRLHKLLGTMVHLHERLKNERSESEKVAKLPALQDEVKTNSETIEGAPTALLGETSGNSTPGTNQKGA